MFVEKTNIKNGINSSSVIHGTELMESINSGWPSETGSLIIQNDFTMILPAIGEKISKIKLGLLTKDTQILGPVSITFRQKTSELITDILLLDKQRIHNFYKFINFTTIQSPFEIMFSEHVGNMIYSATSNFLIETDSELEVPEKYLTHDKL